jgi:AraC-like DNA-binding protein
VPQSAALAEAGLAPHRLQAEGRDFQRIEVDRIWAALVRLKGPTVGLSLARHAPLRGVGLAEYAAQHSPSVETTYQTVTRYARLINRAAELRIEPCEDGQQLTYRVLDQPVPARAPTDFVLGFLVAGVRRLTRQPINPTAVFFQAAPPVDPAPYRTFFGGRVQWAASTNGLSLSRQTLRLPVVDADMALGRLLRKAADDALDALPAHRFEDRLRGVLIELSAEGIPQADQVARRLGLSTRSLQRRLEALKTTFRAFSQHVRMQHAASLLTAGTLTVTEVAFAVGFKDSSAFHRAFRRAFGQAPSSYRGAIQAR